MRKAITVLLGVILIASFMMSCSKDPIASNETHEALVLDCKTIIIKPLIAAQTESMGTVKLQYENGILNVIYFIPEDSDWFLVKTDLYVGTDVPKKAAPGKFPYHNENPDPKYDSYSIPVQPGTCIYFAAHADVQKNGGVQETAWALDDYEFKQGWGWYCYICFPAG